MPNVVLERLVAERDNLHENVDQTLAAVEAEERDPSDAERDLLARHRARLDQLEPQIVQLVELEEQRAASRDARGVLGRITRETPAPPENGDDGDDDPGGDEPEGSYTDFAQYARDVCLVRFGFVGATVEPAVRHRAARRLDRAVSKVITTDVPGLMRPQYLDQIMTRIDRSRPLVDAATTIALSAGKLQWPAITKAPAVGVQAVEKTEAGDGSMTVAMMEAVAQTVLAAANFSWQTVQWSNPDALRLWLDLAAASYARQTDTFAGARLNAVAATVTVTEDSLAGWTAGIAEAAGRIFVNGNRYPNVIAAAPDVGFHLLGLVAADAPVFLMTGTANLATGQMPTIGGLRLVISKAIAAGTAVVGDFEALLTAETPGSPVELRAVEPSIGGIEVGIIGAFASAIADAAAFVKLVTDFTVPDIPLDEAETSSSRSKKATAE